MNQFDLILKFAMTWAIATKEYIASISLGLCIQALMSLLLDHPRSSCYKASTIF